MLKEEMNAMFSDYRLLIEHLKKNEDDKGHELLKNIVHSTNIFMHDIFKTHDKMIENIKNDKQ
jgi:hypothetical protein